MKVINATKQKVVEQVLEANNGKKVDIVIDAAGPPIVMKQAMEGGLYENPG